MAAAAHGGFTRICLMPNTRPPIDTAAAVGQALSSGGRERSPVRVDVIATTTAGRAGAALAPDGGAGGRRRGGLQRRRVADRRRGPSAPCAGLRGSACGGAIVEHAEDRGLTEGAEMHEGVTATILGLRGWPAAAEATAVARAIAILDEVTRRRSDATPRRACT